MEIKDARSFDTHINNARIKKLNEVALLGIKIDKNLTFKDNISELCIRASYKLRTFRKYLTFEKVKLLTNVFINSQFNYAPLIQMFVNKCSSDKILKIYKRTLQIVYKVYDNHVNIS